MIIKLLYSSDQTQHSATSDSQNDAIPKVVKTEVGVANELTERGIPKTEIVLAYHDPFIRQYDGFAVG